VHLQWVVGAREVSHRAVINSTRRTQPAPYTRIKRCSLPQCQKGSHRARRRSDNAEPEDSTDPCVPSLWLINEHYDRECHETCRDQQGRIRAFRHTLKALDHRLSIFNSHPDPEVAALYLAQQTVDSTR